MKRTEWEFEYTASKLAEAAISQRDIQLKKLKWWEQKKLETIDKVKQSGIEVHDSVASSYSHTKGLMGPQLKIDQSLSQDLAECQIKIRTHDDLAKDYEAWRQILFANPESRLKLDHDDWIYFFGTDHVRSNEEPNAE